MVKLRVWSDVNTVDMEHVRTKTQLLFIFVLFSFVFLLPHKTILGVILRYKDVRILFNIYLTSKGTLR